MILSAAGPCCNSVPCPKPDISGSSTFSVELKFTLALTPALSPGERVSIITVLETSQSPLPAPIRCHLQIRHMTTRHITLLKMRRTILPLLGERAGVRAGVISDFIVIPDESYFTPCHPLKLSRNHISWDLGYNLAPLLTPQRQLSGHSGRLPWLSLWYRGRGEAFRLAVKECESVVRKPRFV